MPRKATERSIVELANEAAAWIYNQGWVSEKELFEWLQGRGASPIESVKTVRWLDRQGIITPRVIDGVRGYELVPQRPRPRPTGQYGNWMPVTVHATFISPSLGGLDTPGDETRKHHLRYGGRVIIPRANIVAMLKRAADLLDLGDTPKTAVRRVVAEPVVLDVETTQCVRRPLRPDKVAIEPHIHEAIPAGTDFVLRLAFPGSHFTREMVEALLTRAATQVGLSPAGGANGAWGIFAIRSLQWGDEALTAPDGA